MLEAGLLSSADDVTPFGFDASPPTATPPATSTRPSASRVAVKTKRVMLMLPAPLVQELIDQMAGLLDHAPLETRVAWVQLANPNPSNGQ